MRAYKARHLTFTFTGELGEIRLFQLCLSLPIRPVDGGYDDKLTHF